MPINDKSVDNFIIGVGLALVAGFVALVLLVLVFVGMSVHDEYIRMGGDPSSWMVK
jgi:CHASE3 domain sensor protein